MNREERVKQLYGERFSTKKPQKAKQEYDFCDSRKAYLEGEIVHITFKRDPSIIDLVKRITQRQYIGGKMLQEWEAPVSLDCLEKLRAGHFELDPELKRWEKSIFKPADFDPAFKIPGIKHFDYFEQYQVEGVQLLDHKLETYGGALLADDKGVGKTMQVLSLLQLRLDIRPVLITCPAIAKLTWLAEANFWMDGLDRIQVIFSNKAEKIWGDIVIINYELLAQVKTVDGEKVDVLREDLWDVDWQMIAIDEAHYVSNLDTIRGWALQELSKNTPYVLPITASIARNRPKEIFPLVNIIDPRIFPSFYKFGHRYCGARMGYAGKWEFNGSSNEDELHDLLTRTVMIRRKKEDIFKGQNLKKRRCVVPLPIDNQRDYDNADIDFEKYLRDKTGKKVNSGEAFQRIEELKQLSVKGKLNAAIDWLWDLLETEEKVVVFAEHSFVLDALEREFKSICVRVDGKNTDPKKREAARQAFQRCARCGVLKERHTNDPDACREYVYDRKVRVFLGSRAAITNITLTASYNVVFLELWWSPEDHDQAEDRCYARKGDLHSITSWYLLGHGTIEEYHATLFDIKNRNLTKIADGKELSKEYMLSELLKEYTK